MNTIFRDLSIIWILIHCCIMFMLLFESRFSKKTTYIATIILMLLLIVLNLANVILYGVETAGRRIIFCCAIPSLIFFYIMAKNRDARFLFTFCVVDTVVLEVTFITNILDWALNIDNYIVMFVTRIIIMPIAEFVIIKYIREPYLYLQKNTKKGWGVLSLLAALFYIILIITALYPSIVTNRPEYIPHLVMLLILLPVMYITVLKVLWNQLKLFKSEEENHTLKMYTDMINERLESNAKAENTLKIIRHDIKHRMLLLSKYMDNNHMDEARTLINEIAEQTFQSRLKNYCANYSVNAVLSHYESAAAAKGIVFETDIRLPEVLKISETDLAVILSNGLENAINALNNCHDKRIIVSMFMEDDEMYIEIKNPFIGKIKFDNGLPTTDKESHGYGVRSMAAIVKNNGGIYSFAVEKEYFVFRCAV